MSNARLYAGTALLIAGVMADALDAWKGNVALLVMCGLLLLLTSFAPEGERR